MKPTALHLTLTGYLLLKPAPPTHALELRPRGSRLVTKPARPGSVLAFLPRPSNGKTVRAS